jgi:hypothetical protein
MRTTVRIEEHLLAQAKRLAASTGRTLTQLIEDALREVLARRRPPARRSEVRLRTVGGRGIQPGVDLDDGAALLDLMERRDDAP